MFLPKHNKLIVLLTCVLLVLSCKDKNSLPTGPDETDDVNKSITILYTNDEHGWMEPTSTHGGAAGMVGLWKGKEGYSENGPFLILSGGDMWTGPAISTWTKGEAMIAAMNAMGYNAAALGNHEFDNKIEGLKERMDQAEFPFLSANTREKQSGLSPDFALPYVVQTINGIKVGLIGLTTTTTPTSTFPDHVIDYNFIPYDQALQEVIPNVKADSAELMIIVGHITCNEMRRLAPLAAQLGVSVIGGGHSHEVVNENVSGVAIIESGCNLQNYAKVEIVFDTDADTIVSLVQSIEQNTGGTPDAEVEAIVTFWQNQVKATLSEVIGYVNEEIGQRSNAMYNMVTDSWLYVYPSADISTTNTGGIRQSIPAGNITLGTIVGLLPFENNIIELELTGNQVIDCTHYLIVGGMTKLDGYKLADGTPLDANAMYSVLTTDYLYARDDYNFSSYDTSPYYTSIHYRQPVIDWIKSLMNTSSSNPLDLYLDFTPRQ